MPSSCTHFGSGSGSRDSTFASFKLSADFASDMGMFDVVQCRIDNADDR